MMYLLENWILPLLRVSTPILLAAAGGLISERSGVIQLGLEGAMLFGAFFGAVGAHHFDSAWAGLLLAILSGAAFGLIQAFGVLQLKIDQVVLGMSLNLIALGLTPVLCKIIFGASGTSAEINKQSLFTYGPMLWAVMVPFILHYMFNTRRRGLWVQIAGEHPEALSTAGVSVTRVRLGAIVASTILAAVGGMSLSVMLSSGFSRGMTAGRGYMALAAVIFGQWKPLPTLGAALFFGLVDLIQNRLQGVVVFGEVPLPTQFLQSLPYVLTILVLSGLFKKYIGRLRAPTHLGRSLGLVLLYLAFLGSFQSCKKNTSNQEAKYVRDAPQEIAHNQGNLELLGEMTRVFFDQESDRRKIFGTLSNAAAQGASLEGLLRGILYSQAYNRLELLPLRNSLSARSVSYVEKELRALGIDSNSLNFSPMPRMSIENVLGISDSRDRRLLHSKSSLTTLPRASIPAIKRILVESVYIYGGKTRENQKAFIEWFVSDTLRLNHEYPKADLGVRLRGSLEESFHREWLEQMIVDRSSALAIDRALWEIVNRKIRILNSLFKEQQ